MRAKLHFVQSLARGLTVLQAFSAERPELTLTEVAQATGMNMAAAQRFTDTLMQLGFLHRDHNKRFSLGPKVLTLGFSFLNGSQLRRQADKFIKDFSVKYKKTTNMAILDGQEIIFISRYEAQRFLSYDLHPGSRLPAHCTSQGKVLLAALDDDELADLLETMELKRFTERTVVDRQQLWDDLMLIRRRGYSISNRELTMDLVTLAVPVFDFTGKVMAATNLALPARVAHGETLREMIANLFTLGADLSAALGYSGDYPEFTEDKWPGEPY